MKTQFFSSRRSRRPSHLASTGRRDKRADLAGPGIGDYEELERILPQDYCSLLSIRDTQRAIFAGKHFIEEHLSKALNLMMVTVPLIVDPESGVNDLLDRDGSRAPISFHISNDRDKHPVEAQIVQAATKWKRVALKRFGTAGRGNLCILPPMSTSRRRFLKTACAAAPVILGATDKSGNKPPVIGDGNHRYEAIHDWGELPAGIKYGNTHGVVEDSKGHIYVHHTVNAASELADSMVVFDDKGKFVKSWGKEFKGGAHGLHIQKEGSTEFLYLCDTARGVVVKATLDGEPVYQLGYPDVSEAYKPGADGKKPKYSPTNLAIGPTGDLYVGDGYGSSYINQYNNKGEYIRTFGGKGKEAGKLDCPHGIIVDHRGATPILTVADRGNARIQRFTLDGKHVDFVSGTAMPCHFNFFKNGDVVVPDLGARVTLLDKDNHVILHLGDDSASKWRDTRKLSRDHFTPGKFVAPHGACFDHKGNIFVVEWVEVGRVTKLRKV